MKDYPSDLVFSIVSQLIPLLVDGLGSERNCQRITSVLYDMLDFNMVTLSIDGDVVARSKDRGLNLSSEVESNYISADIKKGNEEVGTFKFYRLPTASITDADRSMVRGIGEFVSTQLTFNSRDYYSSLRSKAELKALQAQINPHFLFNALNTISAMCRTEPLTARKLLIHLSNYFRATIETSPDLIDLNKELNTIFYYLEIEKARFGDRFDVKIDIPMNMSVMVPPLILQPLVENSIKHGFSGNIDGQGIIVISVKKFPEYFEISVEDNGQGMDKATIEKVLSGGYGNEKIGLYNVHQRLKEVYGEKNGLIIESKLGVGTKVAFKVPIRKRSGENVIKSYYSR